MQSVREECLGDALDGAAARWGNAVGWVFDDAQVSFAAMRERADEIARALLREGVEAGDVVAVWMPNLPEFSAVQFACAKIGAITTAINTRFRSFEVEHMLRQSDAKIVIMVERFLKHDYLDVLTQVGALPCSPDGSVDNAFYPSLRRLVSLEERPDPRLMSWAAFLAHGQEVAPKRVRERQAQRHWREPTLIQYTSGTTAAPKGALIDHRYVLNAGDAVFGSMGVKAGEAILNTQPFYHIGGSCAGSPAPLAIGCKVVTPSFYEAERVLQLIERERCVARSGFAAMYIMEMGHPHFRDYDLSSMRAAWCTGPNSLLERIREAYGIEGVTRLYSSTEVGNTIGRHDEPWSVRVETYGRPVPGTEIEIRDPGTRRTLPAGETGEIAMRSWWQMIGYHKQPDETAKVIDAEGWMHTGDRGFLQADGCLHFLGRFKDMMKVGGENVSAEEVEVLLLAHPKIQQAAVIGIPDDRLDEVPMAFVELKAGETMTADELIAYCRPIMANFRVPRRVEFLTEWPMTGSGKIQKHVLRQRIGT